MGTAADCTMEQAKRDQSQPIGCNVEIEDRGGELIVRAALPVDARECVSVSIAGNVMMIRARGCRDARTAPSAREASLCQYFTLPVSVSEHSARISRKDGGIVEIVIPTGRKPSLAQPAESGTGA